MDELDPIHKVELAMLRAEHQKKFQTLITYLKDKVGEGIEYRNAVARVVVSEQGAYYELNDLPEEFSGAVGPDVEQRYVTPDEAVSLLAKAVEAVKQVNRENARHCSILVLYSRRGIIDRKNCYVFEYNSVGEQATSEPLVIGQLQPGVMPLFFKIKLDADFSSHVLDMPRGMVFCIANPGDRHLLIRLPFTGDQVINLTDVAAAEMVQ